MSISEEELQEQIRKLKNERVRQWRNNNKDKVKAINQRYWTKQAKRELEKKGE